MKHALKSDKTKTKQYCLLI